MPNERILILEDHPELLREMLQVLTEAGYQVQSAVTCAQALDVAKAWHLDLLIADIYLPDGSGIEAYAQIHVLHPDIAGIVVTGHSTWELALDALRAGFVGFLVKPVVAEQLLTSVLTALEQEKLRRENARLRALVPLYELSRAFMGTLALTEVLNQIVSTVRQETKADVVSLMLLDDDPNELRIAAAAGLSNDIVKTGRLLIGNGIAGRVAQTGEPLMIADGIPLDLEIRRAMTKPEVGSALSVPLKLRGRVIGVLNLSRSRANSPFTHADLEFATVFAGQAAIAIDQTRLMTKVRQLSEVSQRLARAVDLEEACAVILSAPIEMLGARGTALWILNDTRAPFFRSLGLDGIAVPQIDITNIQQIFQAKEDCSWLILPVQHGDKTLGVLTIRLTSCSLPSEEHMDTLRTITHIAGAVIESHRLRARESQAFREVDRAVRADLNLADLLHRLLNEMIEACGAEGGTIYRWNNERTQLEDWVSLGLGTPPIAARTILEGNSPLRHVDAKWDCFLLAAPMATGNRTEGVIVLTRSSARGDFRVQHRELLSPLSSAAALVVRNAQLYARSEEAAIAEERTRIAREIHDGLAQNLSYLVLKLGVAQKLAAQGKERELKKELTAVSDQLRLDVRDVRRIIFALRPVDIETQGFLPALTKFIKEFGIANEIEITFHVDGDCSHLPPKLETALFRLTQETLNNIRKHAQAKHVWIDLGIEARGMANLQVRDDGAGFDLEPALTAARARGSVGILQMRERAERAGGTFGIETAPGKGTRIQVALPIREAETL